MKIDERAWTSVMTLFAIPFVCLRRERSTFTNTHI